MPYGIRSIKTRLAEERVKSGRSNRWYAEKLGVGELTISNYCRGKHKPSIDNAIKLARLLNVPVDELFPGIV